MKDVKLKISDSLIFLLGMASDETIINIEYYILMTKFKSP